MSRIRCKNNFCKSCINEYLKTQNKCPLCSDSPFLFRENVTLQKILKDIKFICQNCGRSFKKEDEYNSHIESCIIEKYICIICENEFNENNFYEHIIKTHKSDIISLMNQKSMINHLNYKYNKEEFINQKKLNLKISIFNHQNTEEYKKSLNIQHNSKNILNSSSISKKNIIIKRLPLNNVNDNFSLNNYNFPNYNEIQQVEIQNKIPLNNINENFSLNDYNYPNINELKQNEIQREKKLNLEIDSFYINNDSSIKSHRVNTTYVKNDKKDSFYENLNTERISNSINKETKNFNNNIKYCLQENKNIPCSCCKDHICRPGNCLCKKCMLLNIKELKLKKGQLINKKGYICNFERNTFYCNQSYVKIVVNIKKNVFKNNLICSIYSPCPECEILTKLKNFYLN